MNILSAVLASIPDGLILYIQSGILNLITKDRIIRSRFVISLIISLFFGFFAELCFNIFPTGVNLFLALINGLKSCLLVWYMRGKCRISDALTTIIIQEFCSVLCSIIYSAMYGYLGDELYTRTVMRNVVIALTAIAVTFMNIQFKKRRIIIEDISQMISNRVLLFIFLSLFLESGVIEIVEYNISYSSEKIYIINSLLFALTITNAIIVITLIVSVIYRKNSDDINRILRQQVDSQIRHYQKREKLNTEIRGFRHDFNNHVKCLESLLTMERYGEAGRYLQNISNMMPSGEFLFQTGNYIADAILTETQESFENINVEFDGIIPENIDNADLCIVMSNAMNNAAEACCKLSGTNKISVFGNYQQGVFVLIIKNQTLEKGFSTDIIPGTSKSDTESHGFGLSNIQRVVKKYNGAMHTQIKDEMFTLSLTLTINQPEFIS